MWALVGKIAAGLAAFILLFGHHGGDEGRIALEGVKEVTVTDGTGSTVVSTVKWRQGLVVFINDASNVHYARIKIDGRVVGKERGYSEFFDPGERRLYSVKKLLGEDGTSAGDFGSHHVEAEIFVRDGDDLRRVENPEYDFFISSTHRRTPEGSGVYWIIEVHPTYITEGGF